ncbi:virulence-associated E family protein [Methylobrevis albus]|uniref:Virulence-associated E family protein n=1 Tax=Methylobrevis albus TaxID=2793297 RepID=A0A931I2M7_9HYPH|nr:virulence-associated E family protein [Methylobrevis albus]MBH0239117.1 virulence-associated E family protein [Methylobrevis albus]
MPYDPGGNGPPDNEKAARTAIRSGDISNIYTVDSTANHPENASAIDRPEGGKVLRLASARRPAAPSGLIVGERGQPLSIVANVLEILRTDPHLSDLFSFDEMAGEAILRGAIPGQRGAPSMKARPIRDVDATGIQVYIQRHHLPSVALDTVHQAIEARAAERGFHPVRDYLQALEWDGIPRLSRWVPTYLGAEDSVYHCQVGALFLLSMVARVMRPGCKSDYCVVLEGPQGARKSTACAILGGAYFSDSLPDIASAGKDVSIHLKGRWLLEIAEMSAMSKAESAALKAFITRTEERFRPPYGRKEVVQPRHCVFVGTTNEATYLRDATGARRFWPVKVGRIDTDALARDRDQLFAEALHLFNTGANWWPSADFEARHVVEQQSERFEGDAWDDNVRAYIAGKSRVRVQDVAQEALSLPIGRIGIAEQRRIAAILRRSGWLAKRTNTERFFVRVA